MLIPLPAPNAGLLVVGGAHVIFISTTVAGGSGVQQKVFDLALTPSMLLGEGVSCTSPSSALSPRCFSVIDSGRVLVGDSSRGIFLVSVSPTSPTPLSVTFLGALPTPSVLNYLDSGYVFAGSTQGDSTLIRLKPDAPYLETVTVLPSLGPIVDLTVMDGTGGAGGGSSQVVTASGVGRDGSIRIVRAGIGLTEFARLDMPGLRGLWTLPVTSSRVLLLQSFAGSTRVVALEGEDLEELSLGDTLGDPSLDSSPPFHTLAAGEVGNGLFAIVCSDGMRIFSEGVCKCWWSPPPGLVGGGNSNTRITLGAVGPGVSLLAFAGGTIVQLSVDSLTGGVTVVESRDMGCEVSCL